MCDISVQFHSALEVFFDAVLRERCSTIVAEFGSEMVFASALFTMIAHFPGWHSNKVTVCALDDLDVPHDKLVVYRHGAKSFEPVVLVAHQLDSDLGDLHFPCLAQKFTIYYS
jgi:hypothetical protein